MAGSFFMAPDQYSALKQKYPKFNEPWTGEDNESLTQYTQEGMSLEDIADRLQRTKKAIRMRQQSMGLYTPRPTPKKWEAEDDETLKQMYMDGISFEDMAEHFNRSVSAIVARLVHLRLDLFKKGE